MNKEKIKLLMCGDSLNGYSGLSSVSVNILKYFYESNKFDICYYGICNKPINKRDYFYYGEEFKELFDNIDLCDFNSTNFDNLCNEIKPQIVLSLHDPWLLSFIPDSQFRHSFYWVNYCLFETPEYPNYVLGYSKTDPRLEIGKILRDADCSIPVTKMGYEALKKLNVQNIQNNIYIGLDFDKVVTKEIKKSSVFASTKDDDFVFMTCGKNLERKRIDLVLDAFSMFISKQKDKSKYKLYVHSNLNDNIGGTDLLTQAVDLKIADNFLGSLCFSQNTFMPIEELYLKYKACDCYIALPAGEGFGLSFLEALAHNKPVIYSDYAGHKEYCDDYGFAVKIQTEIASRSAYMRLGIADVNDASRQMQNVVDKKYHQKYLNAYDELKDKFDWKIVLSQLQETVLRNYSNNKKEFNLKRIV